MKLRIYYLIYLLLLSTSLFSSPDKRIKTIAIFFPLNASMPSFQNLLEGFKSVISEDMDEPYNLMIEYLDIGRTMDEEYVRHIVELYNEKFKTHPIDVLITIPPFTYSVLKKYGLNALATSATIKLEMDPPIEEQLPSSVGGQTIEVKVGFRIGETMNHSFDLFPEYKKVYIISGSSLVDHYFMVLMEQSIKNFSSTRQFTFINKIGLDSMVQVARKIPSESIVFIPIFLSDVNKAPYSTPEAIRVISANCKAPVFPIFDSFIKTRGGFGGFVFSYMNLGKELGRAAREILNGKDVTKIRIDKGKIYNYFYDWKQLKKWNLEESDKIPAESIIFNKENDFIHEYRWQILFVLFVLITETFLIIYLITLNKRQKKIVRQKIETENLFLEMSREDRLSTMVELTASLSHELNQPLTAILYSAQAGKRFLETDKLDPEQAKEIFDNIIEDDKRAAGLISSVRSLMKLETREKDKVNLNAVIHETIKIFYPEAMKQNIKIAQKLHLEPVFVFGDKIQLQQVLLNLISNAAMAMENCDISNKTIEIHQLLEKKSVTVLVRDSGPGIDTSIKDKLFKPFVTSRISGFGIGLAVSRSIIEKHNGEIWADNIPAGGAEFSFKLPIIKDE
jgi:signal transduction histidine kinase